MNSSDEGKKCIKCNVLKEVKDFYTKGARIESRCKVCQRKERKERYKKKKSKEKKRSSRGRLMIINNVRFIDSFEKNKVKKDTLCLTVENIIKDHVKKVILGEYDKEIKNAA
jgi:hypothetical protein